mmetsp:Transcript_15974/g.23701  ORF Transcript_15974/g.23701 Transcript_15974/m.23701 type:complete len:80 (+) Transcript_15974:3-242(+)
MISAGFATEEELKQVEKEVRVEVQEALRSAKSSSQPDLDELFTDIYTNGNAHKEPRHRRLESDFPADIRMPDVANTKFF